MQKAKIMAAKYKRTFPNVPFEDLESQAILEFLERENQDEALAWKNVEWRMYDYALKFNSSIMDTKEDAASWAMISMDADTAGVLLMDCEKSLTPEAYKVVLDILEYRFECDKRLTMRQIRLKLMAAGWVERKARAVLIEIQKFWRAYAA